MIMFQHPHRIDPFEELGIPFCHICGDWHFDDDEHSSISFGE